MLTRFYVDNFKCLVNFEFNIGSLALLLGRNGSGKSSVLESLRLVRDFISGEEVVTKLFPPETLTQWESRNVQTWELEIEGNGGRYLYRLEIEHQRNERRSRVKTENLKFNGKPLFESGLGQAHLFRDDHSRGPDILCDWSRSSLPSAPERSDNSRLTWFKKRASNIWVVRFDPQVMPGRTETESQKPNDNMSNFASWFRHVTQEQQRQLFQLTEALSKDVLEGFDSFRLADDGEQARILKVKFLQPGALTHSSSSSGSLSLDSSTYELRLEQLSDGQRVLLALYSLAFFAFGDDMTLCFDEPDNFVALPEIQPWLLRIVDASQERKFQGVLISHHPEMINLLAQDHGYWIERVSGGPTAPPRKIREQGEGTLPMSELVARRWVHA